MSEHDPVRDRTAGNVDAALDQGQPLAEVDPAGLEGLEDDDGDTIEIPLEVSEADALEQTRPLVTARAARRSLPADVPEADALEQGRPAADDDEDEFR